MTATLFAVGVAVVLTAQLPLVNARDLIVVLLDTETPSFRVTN